MSTPTTPPGWYDDGHGNYRWWDGREWTQYTSPITAAAAAPAVQPTPAPARARTLTYEQQASLVKVRPSRVWWAVPIALVLAALAGTLIGLSMRSAVDPTEVRRAFTSYEDAVAERDCAALEAVTTAEFRDRLQPGPFSCESWRASNLEPPRDDSLFAMRLGSVGFVAVEQERATGSDSETTTGSPIVYVLVHEDGVWRIAGTDQ